MLEENGWAAVIAWLESPIADLVAMVGLEGCREEDVALARQGAWGRTGGGVGKGEQWCGGVTGDKLKKKKKG